MSGVSDLFFPYNLTLVKKIRASVCIATVNAFISFIVRTTQNVRKALWRRYTEIILQNLIKNSTSPPNYIGILILPQKSFLVLLLLRILIGERNTMKKNVIIEYRLHQFDSLFSVVEIIKLYARCCW